ncbi:isopentenyl-diphosphate Delta-isomerase [Corynebacterium imitans]|uniref:isopentenyl-diphosphate Delta-isomerase n=1 Tax=Corynebacterium imitans TaxID=156978 RepID=UPI001EF2E702|nr:isopentenyl-diphosphate Delta-isomerase [Corynebacterium imitans]MCG7278231.1 isopentenyl-diphosphate Delta-isomerase [Corynebacterium imitans]
MREQVVLIDATGTPIGAADKAEVHTDSTPLHLAFSCWLLDADGRLLLTRRALGKLTWPGVWTNSFCGHPAPGEATVDAVRRRAAEELGMPAIDAITEVLPDFRYRAVDSSGVVENEVCPVFSARMAPGVELDPNPDEVDSWAWLEPLQLIRAAEATPFAFSPWLVEELADERLRDAL